MESSLERRLRSVIRSVPDFPKSGIMFRDITTLLLRPDLMAEALAALALPFAGRFDCVAGVESRGFIIGAGLAGKHGLPFVPLRKPGKLPAAVHRETYCLEYGTDCLEIHQDACGPGRKVLIVDDLLATGGTAVAAARLVANTGATVAGLAFLIELDFLHGRDKLADFQVHSLVRYADES